MINTVLRLFAAMFLYILELHVWSGLDFRALSLGYLKEVASLKVTNQLVDDVGRESFKF